MDKLFLRGKEYLKKAGDAIGNATEGISLPNVLNSQSNSGSSSLPKDTEIGGKNITFLKLLDEGGFSFVYLVRDVETGQEYALKQLISQDKESFDKIAQEINYLKLLSGKEGIIRLIGTKIGGTQSKKHIFILMELAQDSLIKILQRKLDARSQFTESEIYSIFLQICMGVYQMHSQNPPIIHRDLKVENVLLSDGKFKLCDFGSATTKIYKDLELQRDISEAEMDIQQNTTLPYRSPEMADLYSGNIICERSDIWALGCVLFKMMFFQGPFEEASNLQIMNGKYTIPTSPSYSSEMISLVKYMLTMDPVKRPDIYDVITKVCEITGKKVNIEKIHYSLIGSSTPTTPVKREEKKSVPSIKKPSNTSGGGDLFSQLEWHGQGQETKGGSEESWDANFDDFEKPSKQPQVKKTPSNQTPSKSISSVPSEGGLFGMLEWHESESKPRKPLPETPKQTTTLSTNKQGGGLFDQLDWNDSQKNSNVKEQPEGDLFGQLDWNEGKKPETSQTSKSVKRVSGGSSTSSQDGLFGQLDWNSTPTPKSTGSSNPTITSEDWGDLNFDSKVTAPTTKVESKHIKQASFGRDSKDPFSSLTPTPTSFDASKKQFETTSLVSTNIGLWISKATAAKGEIKTKYVKKLVAEAWNSKKDVMVYLRARPIFSSNTVVFKVLNVIHALIQNGPQEVLDKLVNDPCLLLDIRENWSLSNNSDKSFSLLIVEYASYLLHRVSLAKRHPSIEGNFSLANFVSSFTAKELTSKFGKYTPFSLDTVIDLEVLQVNLFEIKSSLHQDTKNVVKKCAIPLCQYDAMNLSRITYFILTKLPPSSRLDKLNTDFNNNLSKLQITTGYKDFVESSKIDPVDEGDSDSEDAMDIESSMDYNYSKNVTLDECLKVQGNDFCADCRAKSPNFCSMTYGIFICSVCCGHHKNLGISKVRSMTLDKWSAEQILFLYLIGNKRANRTWEKSLPRNEVPTTKEQVSMFVQNKYIKKKWIK